MNGRFTVASISALLLAGSLTIQRADPVLPVRVYAAEGVAGALKAIGAAFTRKTGTAVEVTAGGSVALSREILRGAPADLFVPEGSGVLAALLKVASPAGVGELRL